jgi:ribonuclease VapC
MFIDTSAFIAILAGEPASAALATAIEAAESRATSPLVRLETCMRLASKLDVSPEDAQAAFDQTIADAAIEVTPITDAMGREAVAAFSLFGKGRGHPAQLNLADCVVYACAKACQAPLLCTGSDFAKTDIPLAGRF